MPLEGPQRRRWQAAWRDTLLLVKEFRKPLLLFAAVLLGCGLLFQQLSALADAPVGFLQGVYIVLCLTFLQTPTSWPAAWYLQPFFLLMPLVGIATLSQGLADFATMLFNRRTRGKEWSMAVASTFSGHMILVGLGHLGFRVVKNLHGLGKDVVVVELDPDADLVEAVRAMDVPVIQGDATRQPILVAAGVERARSIILCTQNDSLNLQMALKARSLNPTVEVVIRIFDNDFAEHLTKQSGFKALSATSMAAPLFAAAAANMDITPPLVVDGQAMSLARFTIAPGSILVGRDVDHVENTYEVSIVLISRDQERHAHPDGSSVFQGGDNVAVLGAPANLNRLVQQ